VPGAYEACRGDILRDWTSAYRVCDACKSSSSAAVVLCSLTCSDSRIKQVAQGADSQYRKEQNDDLSELGYTEQHLQFLFH
jgi:hypothetical protein